MCVVAQHSKQSYCSSHRIITFQLQYYYKYRIVSKVSKITPLSPVLQRSPSACWRGAGAARRSTPCRSGASARSSSSTRLTAPSKSCKPTRPDTPKIPLAPFFWGNPAIHLLTYLFIYFIWNEVKNSRYSVTSPRQNHGLHSFATSLRGWAWEHCGKFWGGLHVCVCMCVSVWDPYQEL